MVRTRGRCRDHGQATENQRGHEFHTVVSLRAGKNFGICSTLRLTRLRLSSSSSSSCSRFFFAPIRPHRRSIDGCYCATLRSARAAADGRPKGPGCPFPEHTRPSAREIPTIPLLHDSDPLFCCCCPFGVRFSSISSLSHFLSEEDEIARVVVE